MISFGKKTRLFAFHALLVCIPAILSFIVPSAVQAAETSDTAASLSREQMISIVQELGVGEEAVLDENCDAASGPDCENSCKVTEKAEGPMAVLRNSLLEGKISSSETFKKALDTALSSKIATEEAAWDRGGFSSDISSYAKDLPGLDNARVEVDMMEHSKAGKLFNDIPSSIPDIYGKTIDLCEKFNPKSGSNDHSRLNSQIDEYLSDIEKTKPVQYALRVTQTTIKDLKANWFGSGLGFEHVFAGEVKGSSVSGYHFWYKYYNDERKGRCTYLKTLEGGNDPNIFTGSFTWDADGPGNAFKAARKSKGGFVVKSGAPAMLALGHIAIEVAKKNNCPGAFTFQAALNDKVYIWQMFTMGRSIRSLYPMVQKKGSEEEQRSEVIEVLVDHAMDLYSGE